MREILFRGKSKDNDVWVEGYYCGKVNKTIFSPAEDSAQIVDKDLYWHELPVSLPKAGTFGVTKFNNFERKRDKCQKKEAINFLKDALIDMAQNAKTLPPSVVYLFLLWNEVKK